jgi:hypothetical protein
MKSFYTRGAALAFALALTAAAAPAQRPPVMTDPSEPRPAPAEPQQQGPQPARVPKPTPAPPTFKAKYEGGILGYRKQDGWLAFDDLNSRLVFKDKQQRELFSISYEALLAAWADTKSRTSTPGRVIAGVVPYGLGLPGLLLRNKTRYVVLQYSDPDTAAEGVTSFKVETKDLVASVLSTLAEKAELTQRGDAYVRRKDAATKTTTPAP